ANVPKLGTFIPDQIHFAIGSGPQTIQVNKGGQGVLPAITESVVIDGSTQPGFAGQPLIELDGSPTVGVSNGLNITGLGGGSTIKGLAINRFANGIVLGGNNNTIQGNYLGTDAGGTQDRGNADNGIFISGSFNLIGGAGPGQGNLISANKNRGITLSLAAAGN